jgi:cyclic-di-AMP phosphodiesterase PgpH
MQQRNDILLSTAYIALMCAVLTFSTGTLLSNDMMEVLESTAMGGVGILLSGILAIGFLPVFETTFDIVTTVKLLELSNPNSPLLKKLLMEAPGTYHHSVLVSNLAELAAEEIGGNSVLARIGSFYHDIGKTKRPYFFKENQIGKDNPHDKITPNLSTLIITSHVKDGLEMAKEYNLPKVIRDIIAQHHGTTLVKYFYYKMKNSPEGGEEVKEADFRYPGPIPESKEAGIIMLADSVEAAVRKIEEMVNNIIKDKLHSGQLDNCDLTLKDLTKIRQCFLKVLSGIYHERIEYPTEEKGVK